MDSSFSSCTRKMKEHQKLFVLFNKTIRDRTKKDLVLIKTRHCDVNCKKCNVQEDVQNVTTAWIHRPLNEERCNVLKIFGEKHGVREMINIPSQNTKVRKVR
jgi:hypothetical protein